MKRTTWLCGTALGILAVSILMGGCPAMGDNSAQIDQLTQARDSANKTAADAQAATAVIQKQLDANNALLLTAKQGDPNVAALVQQNTALAAQMEKALKLVESNQDVSKQAQNALNKIAADSKRNEATWTGIESTLGTISTVAGTAAPVSGPLAAPLGLVALIAGLLGAGVKQVHTALVTVPGVKADAKADAAQAIGAIQASNNMIATGASHATILQTDQHLADGLTPGAKALWNLTPDSIPLAPTMAAAAKAAA